MEASDSCAIGCVAGRDRIQFSWSTNLEARGREEEDEAVDSPSSFLSPSSAPACSPYSEKSPCERGRPCTSARSMRKETMRAKVWRAVRGGDDSGDSYAAQPRPMQRRRTANRGGRDRRGTLAWRVCARVFNETGMTPSMSMTIHAQARHECRYGTKHRARRNIYTQNTTEGSAHLAITSPQRVIQPSKQKVHKLLTCDGLRPRLACAHIRILPPREVSTDILPTHTRKQPTATTSKTVKDQRSPWPPNEPTALANRSALGSSGSTKLAGSNTDTVPNLCQRGKDSQYIPNHTYCTNANLRDTRRPSASAKPERIAGNVVDRPTDPLVDWVCQSGGPEGFGSFTRRTTGVRLVPSV